MRSLLRTTLLAAILLAAGSAFAGQVSIGVTIGAPPPPRVVRVRSESPGPEFIWVEGYWYPSGRHYRWHDGYWTRPPYEGYEWEAPHYDGRQYFAGYWNGDRGRFEHNHHWDRSRERDYDRGRGHGKDHDHDRDRDRDRDHDHH